MKKSISVLALGACTAVSALLLNFTKLADLSNEWPEYLGGPERTHYSPLKQITPDNVQNLRVAWEYHTRDTSGQIQCNPIVVDGVLYATTASVQVFALDAATGREKWRFADSRDPQWYNTSRGVTYWAEGDDKRILFTAGPWLYALDARTGQMIGSFGEGGRVSLRLGLPEIAQNKFICSNTPGTIYKDLIVMPVRLSEGPDAAPGHVRAFNVKTGKLAWTFRTIPHPGEPGYETWGKENWKNTDVGAANNWAGMAIDRARGIIYVPTGSAGYDFYGGNRPGKNLYANCLLALDAATGKHKWHYQVIHHDVWDRDLPSAPTLVQIRRNNKVIDAVAQITKSGFVFVFDRVTGESLFPIKEVPVPTNGLPGEKPWATQPVPQKPAPFSRQTIGDNDISPFAENREELLARLKKIRHKNQFELPSEQGTLIFPGFDGGGEWGGPAYDTETGILYVNSNEMAWVMKMEEVPKADALTGLTPGHRVYTLNCANCHGPELQGNPASGYPSLKGINARRDQATAHAIVKGGKGMMPGFSHLKEEERQVLIDFLFEQEKKEVGGAPVHASQFPLPYKMDGYNKFLDKNGYPAISPPWGQLSAINLNTGEYLWKVVLGEFKELTAKGIPQTGTENYGGPVVTAGGVLFIAATKDGMFRAFDKKTGKVLYETKLPAAGFATPAVYEANGKQYIVIACGGTKLGTPKGESYVAFALP
ncbi:PQQ-binding-like beta-propeller repeat protein [Telluribacter sp.]|jgi:quinoprotein glucose dehydrogenase|uniref:outer membrane protein assembly factor BamB family protein n=1 Tax=Telluribacter sp. TaxID=1978767 RepID=UPI002E11C8A7|nr:PQQ-binding-like beta-propeller repeat protein [Telluribacter sp.]